MKDWEIVRTFENNKEEFRRAIGTLSLLAVKRRSACRLHLEGIPDFNFLRRADGTRTERTPGYFAAVTETARILSAIERGDPGATDQLWPVVYEELRRLAARELAREAPGQTLQATALVHEAYVRLTGKGANQRWTGRRHFFLAAAKAMRNILVENARRKKAVKRGGGLRRGEYDLDSLHAPAESDDVLALDEALDRLAASEPEVADLVKLRYFAGLSVAQAAATLGVAPRTADAWWAYARAWLLDELLGPGD
jgi:RNA polymerase sigma factor (TIGR02999 family)